MMAVAEVVQTGMSALRRGAAEVGHVARRLFDRGSARAQTAMRIEQTLEAVQAGSFCRTTPLPPEPAQPDLAAILQANLDTNKAR